MDNTRTLKLMNKFFKKGTYKGEKGWYGYKLFDSDTCGYMHPIPKQWRLVDGSLLTLDGLRPLNKDIDKECASGIHFATKEWVVGEYCKALSTTERVFEVFVPRSNLDNIVLHKRIAKWSSYSEVKVRTDRLTLVHQIDISY